MPDSGVMTEADAAGIGQPPGVLHESAAAGIPALPAGVYHESEVGGNQPFTQMPTSTDLANAAGIAPEAQERSRQMIQAGASMVGKVTKVLSAPMRLVSGAIVSGAAALGVPGAAELKQQTNPEGRWLPDSYFNDITDFALSKADQAMGLSQMGDQYRLLVAGTKLGVGGLANVLGDPLMYTKIGTLTKAAEEFQKAGLYSNQAAATERSLLAIGSPLSSSAYELIGMNKVQPVIDKLAQLPGVKQAASVLRALSPDTGYADVDLHNRVSDGLARGETNALKQGYLMPMADRNYTPEEKSLMFALGESSSNITPAVPSHVLKAALTGGKTFQSEAEVTAAMQKSLPGLAQKAGMIVDPARADQLIDGALQAKRSDTRFLENAVKAGKVDESNIATSVIDNHMPHVRDPRFAGMQKADNIETSFSPSGAKPYTGSPIKQRTFLGSVDQANAAIEAKYGPEFKDFFITDPHLATAMREGQSLKLIRDSQTMDLLGKYGVRMTPTEAQASGRAFIEHPDFKGKNIVVVGEHGVQAMNKFSDVAFPRDIAAKMNYRFGAPFMRNVTGFLGNAQDVFDSGRSAVKSLNGINRATVFMSESLFGRNVASNLVKAHVAGMGYDALMGARSALFSRWGGFRQSLGRMAAMLPGEDQGFRAVPSLMNPNGKFYSAKEFSDLATKFGITGANAFHDGVADFLQAGKQVTLQQMKAAPVTMGLRGAAQVAQNIQHNVVVLGEHGENLVRAALFRQRLMDGWEPGPAAAEVTKWLFDYTRNSPLTDAARFFMPFVQHPIKEALLAPENVARGAFQYNQLYNSFPRVLAAAFQDPLHQAAVNQLLPPTLRLKDATVGPMIPGNSWLANFFAPQDRSGNKQDGVLYFNQQGPLSVLNHFDYTSKAALQHQTESNYGLSPFWAAALHFVQGKDNFDRPLAGTARWNNLFWEGLLGNIALPNTIKLVKNALGGGNPQLTTPLTATLANAAWGTFGGYTPLDQDYQVKILSLAHARRDLLMQGSEEVRKDAGALASPGAYSQWLRQSGREIVPTSNADVYAEAATKIQQASGQIGAEEAQANAARAFLKGGLSAKDYAARIRSIDDTLGQVNDAYSFGMQRYLDMAKGSKSPADARVRAGIPPASK